MAQSKKKSGGPKPTDRKPTDDKPSDRKPAAAEKNVEKKPEIKRESIVSRKGVRKGAESLTFVLVAALVLVLANVAGYFFLGGVGRFDFTRNRLYSLSDGSKNLVGHLQDDMEITAYFTSDLPPPFNETERYVRDMLAEYEASSGGRLHVRFVDPDEDEEKEAAQADGIQEVPHQVIENDSVQVMNGYRGIVIRYLGEKKTLPVIQDTRGLEYEITSAIQQLVRDPLPIGVITGHDGPTPTKGIDRKCT